MIALKTAYVTLHLYIYPYKACAQSDWQSIRDRVQTALSEYDFFTLENRL